MTTRPRFPLLAGLALGACLGVLQGCAREPYRSRALDVEAAAADYADRRTDDPALKHYMVAHGVSPEPWPVRSWGLGELILVAFFYRPELQVARAQAAAARADVAAAAPRGPIKVTPVASHHTQSGAQTTPWSLGFELEIPLTSGSQSRALTERAEYLAQAAELNVGRTAWQIRSEVRARLVDLYAARERARTLQTELEQQQAALAMLERRMEAGYASAIEVDSVRLRAAQSKADLAAARTDTALATGRLAEALALPIDALGHLDLSFTALDTLTTVPAEPAARRDALTNRLDVRARLLEFSAADAAVRIEVARQYPTLSLRPGYLWDQGDNIWAIAVDLFLPASVTYRPAIAAAEAHREVAAQQALAVQSAVIAEIGTRLAAYAQAVESAKAGADASRTERARSAQVQRQFDAGHSDRLELTLARIEALGVERRALEARVEAQRALGHLEDAIQEPLAGPPIASETEPDAPTIRGAPSQ